MIERFALGQAEKLQKKAEARISESVNSINDNLNGIIDQNNEMVKAVVSIYELLDQNNQILRELARVAGVDVEPKPVPHTDMTIEKED